VGPGGSQEAAYGLQASVAAGTYHLVLDCVITATVDVTFDLVHRRGSDDTTLATWNAHYAPIGAGNYDAQPFEYDEDAPAIDFKSGDQLVFRYTGANTVSNEAYIPNGDGQLTSGRIPSITLP
jgi:hypothetical protein